MQGPKGNRRRRSSERPNYGGIGAAAVLGATAVLGTTVTGNEKLLDLRKKAQQTVLFAYGGTGDALVSISAQRNHHSYERLETSGKVLRIFELPKGSYNVLPYACCRKKYISKVTGIFMHGLYNKFEYPNFGEDPNLPSKGFKCVEKFRPIKKVAPESSKSGMRKVVDNKSINQPVDRTYVDHSAFQPLTLYLPGQADDVKRLWNEFGIDLSAEQLKQWQYEFYLAGHWCMKGDTESIFLPFQFATAILQICQNLHDSWISWSELYNKKSGLDNVDISHVKGDLKECFANFAKLYLNFYNKSHYQDCDGYYPEPREEEEEEEEEEVVEVKERCAIACCHCDHCGGTNQNRRTEMLKNLVKEGMLECSGHPDNATLADCKKQVSLSLSIWLQECILSDYFEFCDDNRSFLESDGSILYWEKIVHAERLPGWVGFGPIVKGFEVPLPRWFHVKYSLNAPKLPRQDTDNEPPKEICHLMTMRMLRDEMRAHRNKEKELEWARNMIRVPLVVDDFISQISPITN